MFKTLFTLSFIAILFTACTESGKNTKAKSSVAKPDIELQAAVMSGNLAAVKQHIEAGSDLNAKEAFSGSTPLVSAATFGQPEIAKALIDAGADLSIKNNDGATALHAASFFCRVEIVQLLIDARADKTARNNFGLTARESVMGPFAEVKPVYNLMKQQLAPLGVKIDMEVIEKTRPVIAMMLQ